MSALPTLDDLQSKARLPGVNPRHGLSLDLRLHQTDPHSTLQPAVIVTPSTILQEREYQRSTGLFQNCSSVFKCNRFKSEQPAYKPLHRKISTSHSTTSGILSPWRRWPLNHCFFVTILAISFSTFMVWTTLVIWNLANSKWYASRCVDGNCRNQEHHAWYRDATFYEIFPASFQDTDSDGYGDFQGIINRLDYIQRLGMTAIRLNSIFSALDYPLEYEHIIDLHNADPHLGRMDDFRRLVKEAHARGMKVVIELNPTITSDQHTWALHWQRGIPGYEHFYASANRSKDPPEMENSEGPPPEDWEQTQSTFGGHYVLNWSNPFVQEEYQKALRHWIETEIDGIYMKHLEKMHVFSPIDMPEIIHQWRTTLDRPSSWWMKKERPLKRVLIVSAKFVQELAMDLEHSSSWKKVLHDIDLMDYPILVGNGPEMAAQVSELRKFSRWPIGSLVPMWHLGSCDTFRMASRVDQRYHMAAFYLLMTLPGANSVFFGDEIGLKDSFDAANGKVYRGGQLTPMQWTPENSTGGFTDNTTIPWLPQSPEHTFTNVLNQQPRLTDFIRSAIFRNSTLKSYKQKDHRVDILDPNIIVIERTHHRHKSKRILMAANFGNVSEEKEFPEAYGNVKVVMTTAGPTRTRVRSRGFTISPGAAFLAEVTLMYYPSSSSNVD